MMPEIPFPRAVTATSQRLGGQSRHGFQLAVFQAGDIGNARPLRLCLIESGSGLCPLLLEEHDVLAIGDARSDLDFSLPDPPLPGHPPSTTLFLGTTLAPAARLQATVVFSVTLELRSEPGRYDVRDHYHILRHDGAAEPSFDVAYCREIRDLCPEPDARG